MIAELYVTVKPASLDTHNLIQFTVILAALYDIILDNIIQFQVKLAALCGLYYKR